MNSEHGGRWKATLYRYVVNTRQHNQTTFSGLDIVVNTNGVIRDDRESVLIWVNSIIRDKYRGWKLYGIKRV